MTAPYTIQNRQGCTGCCVPFGPCTCIPKTLHGVFSFGSVPFVATYTTGSMTITGDHANFVPTGTGTITSWYTFSFVSGGTTYNLIYYWPTGGGTHVGGLATSAGVCWGGQIGSAVCSPFSSNPSFNTVSPFFGQNCSFAP